ncbi:MAG TPA: transglutaminase-like domain-containing protein [Sphingobium sp.]|uniref:SirB1 family protein n=1 Tax=Sphingobium sp. TaxID=1912891 RepID=UPI002ED4EC02
MIAAYGLMDDEEIELDIAALELSELDHEGVDLGPYVTLLQEIAEHLAEAGADADTPEQQAKALATVFSGEFGFAGDVDSYDAPLNADLIRVLDRRQGLPVSLSILYVAAARRMGWTAFALNTPGHVLVRIGEDMTVVIDPFNDGRIVPPERLMALLARALGGEVEPQAEHIAPMSNRAVLVRLLANQASRAEQAGDANRALTIYDRMTQVAPDNADGWWQLARLQLQEGSVDATRLSLSSMLEVTRDPERREMVVAALEAIAAR